MMSRLIVAAAVLGAAFTPLRADACGGFFCSGGIGNPPPVVQTGEKILFANDNGHVTAHVQILYQGDPRKFAWVVPTPSVPTLKVGSDQVFSIIDQATQPTFNVNWKERCQRPLSFGCGLSAPSDRLSSGAIPPAEDPGVTVLSQKPIGPFDTALLSATDPQALKNWLGDNGFDLAPEAEPLISYYVDKGDTFVALKLQSDKSNGDLQPIVIEYDSDEGPCVPIRLTSVAAQPDLGIAVFVLGQARAVPANYLSLEINEAKIDWVNRGANYPQVVTEAANEARGHGFVTDYAGPNSIVQPQISNALSTYSKERVSSTDPVEFVAAVRDANFIGSSQNVTAILNRCVPVPESWASDPSGFYLNIESHSQELAGMTVDQPSCGDDIDSLVAQPLRDVGALMNKLPVLTRLYTTMSPDEMTEDPIFTFNPDLPDVSNVRTVDGKMLCNGSTPTDVEFTTSDGRSFIVPWQSTMERGPSLRLGYEAGTSGTGTPVIDNRDELDGIWRQTTGCGCTIAANFSAVALGILLMALKGRRRFKARGDGV